MAFDSQALGTTRGQRQENEDGDTHYITIPRVEVSGLKMTVAVQAASMRPGPYLYLPACALVPPGPLPCCSHARLLATLNVLSIFIPPCFYTHGSYFLECSYSTSNCPAPTHPERPSHLYYPFSVKSTPSCIPPWKPSMDQQACLYPARNFPALCAWSPEG